jgi:hypothetical protein
VQHRTGTRLFDGLGQPGRRKVDVEKMQNFSVSYQFDVGLAAKSAPEAICKDEPIE